MKRIFFIALGICSLATFNSYAQTDSLETRTTPIENVEQKPLDVDSITIAQIRAIYDRMENLVPRYKIFQTENINILLKLDTATGKVWMVQYGTGDSYGMVVPVDDSSLLYSWEDIEAGRFELYPTKNMYNFILIDTKKGYTYQVQWHTKESSRMRVGIY